ncbi:MAG TPA: hypothetical protein VG943_18020 [Caulobacterales bacterium]|nr:hypothetical protein [Caulobacterales bacterium]
MNELSIAKRILVLLAILGGACAGFALGLTLLNVRNDFAFAGGAALVVLAPVGGGVALWSMLRRD